MRLKFPDRLEEARELTGPYATRRGDPCGRFLLSRRPADDRLCIIASAALEGSGGWEHVSVSTRRRTPNWTEMCFVKDLFWHEEECVVQFHPPRSEYVNNHPFCLHLWRHVDGFATPPSILVGVKSKGVLTAAGSGAEGMMDAPRRIQRRRTAGWRMPENTIYVGRPTIWGNPYQTSAMSPGEAVRFFERRWERLAQTESGRVDLARLRGKNLACWCRLDAPCHADVLLRIANAGGGA